MFRFLAIPFALLLSACEGAADPSSSREDARRASASVPAANTVVASDSVHIKEPMFELDYRVEVIATQQSHKGVYEVLVSYGHNDASTQITMPEADEPIVPVLRRGPDQHTYIIGFHYGADTSFKEYYQIDAGRGKTVMKYLKAYSFK